MNAVSTVTATRLKSLEDVKLDMSELYDDLRAKRIEREDAAELANITGKYLKAYALEFAERVFEDGQLKRLARP